MKSLEPIAKTPSWSHRAWERLIAAEKLIDLAEWAHEAGEAPVASDCCAVTSRLWARIEAIPFAELGRSSIRERLTRLVRAATCAMERSAGTDLALAGRREITLEFAAPLPSRAGDPHTQRYRAHIEARGSGGFRLVLAMCDDFERHPAELLGHDEPGHDELGSDEECPPPQAPSPRVLSMGRRPTSGESEPLSRLHRWRARATG